MTLLQIKKLLFRTTLAFLIIVLLSFHIHVQAENTDKRGMAEALWEQGREAYNAQMSSYFQTPAPGQEVVQQENNFLSIMEKFNNSLNFYKELGDKQSVADLLTWLTRVCLEIGKYADAFKYLKESNDIYDKLDSGPGDKASVKDIKKAMKAMFYYVTAKEHEDEGDLKSALAKYKATLKLLRKMGERLYEATILLDIGALQCKLESHSDAEKYTEQALLISRELGKKGNEGRLLYNMAVLCNNKGENAKSLEYMNKALKIFEQFKDKNGMLISLAWKGLFYYYQNDYTKALDFYKQAQVYSKDIEDKSVVAEINEKLGDVHRGMGYLNIPVDYYKQALNIIQEVGNDPKEGDILYTIGQLYSGMGEYKSAQETLNKAMQIYRKHNMIIDQGETLVEIGKVNSNLSNYLEAIENLKGALKIFEGIKDSDASKSLALTTLGNVYRLLGNDETAKEYDEEYDSKNKAEENVGKRNKWDQLSFLQEQARYFIEEDKNDKALDAIRKILDLGNETDNKLFERFCISGVGFVYRIYLHEYSKALGFYKQALEVGRSQNDKSGELMELLKIADTYDYPYLSDYQNALDYYEQALIIAKEIGNKPSEEKCLRSIGQIYMDQEKDEKAEEYLKKALLVSSEMGAQEKIWETQNKLGLLVYLSGDLQKAKSYYIESIRGKISVEEYKTSFIEDKLSVYTELIYLLLKLKENEEAFNYVERAKSRALLDLLGNRLKLKESKDKELSQEEMRLQKKIKGILNEMRKDHSQPNEKQRKTLTGWNKELKETRKQYAKHLLRLKQENSELHSLLNVDPLTLKEVQALIDSDTTLLEYYIIEYEDTRQLDIVTWIVSKAEHNVIIQTLSSTSNNLTSWIESFREKISTLQPYYEVEAEALYDILIRPAKKYIKTDKICLVPYSIFHYLPFQALINVPEISGIGAMLNVDNGILTVASVVEGASAFEAGLKPGDKIIEIDESPTVNMSLQEAVSRLKGNPSTTVLLAIEEGESKTRKKVVLERKIMVKSSDYSKLIVSDTKGKELKSPRFLIEEYDIFYAPSASVLKFVLEKRKKVTGKVLAFGNPELEDKNLNLPYAEEEVESIKESYPDTSIFVKDKATEEKVKQLSCNYNIIHFASHGELNPQSPLFSCIKMAKEKDEDGRLEVHEIFNLDLDNTSLVTLSACETGLGKLSSGDELIGLTRGFIYAGTPSIVASLWNVNDKSTSDLMSLFYKNLKTHSKVESLRMAQIEMINGEAGRGIVRGVGGITTSEESKNKPQSATTVNGSHPYFWAPFILLGDWK